MDEEIDEFEQPIVCPVTGMYCSGDLSYLCDDYGCARKIGLSPSSEFEQDII
jgi:hypothetical protein